MINLDIEIIGEEKVLEALGKLGAQLRDFRAIWPKVSSTFDEIERRQFDSLGSTGDSGSWTPLSTPYAKWKAVNYPGEPILHLTGNLRRSLTSSFNPDAIFETTADSLTRGSKLPYASVHQRGSHFIVRRPPIDLTESDRLELLATFRDGFSETARALGFEVA